MQKASEAFFPLSPWATTASLRKCEGVLSLFLSSSNDHIMSGFARGGVESNRNPSFSSSQFSKMAFQRDPSLLFVFSRLCAKEKREAPYHSFSEYTRRGS